MFNLNLAGLKTIGYLTDFISEDTDCVDNILRTNQADIMGKIGILE